MVGTDFFAVFGAAARRFLDGLATVCFSAGSDLAGAAAGFFWVTAFFTCSSLVLLGPAALRFDAVFFFAGEAVFGEASAAARTREAMVEFFFAEPEAAGGRSLKCFSTS